MTRRRTILAICALAATAAGAGSGPAVAHVALDSVSPRAGSVRTASALKSVRAVFGAQVGSGRLTVMRGAERASVGATSRFRSGRGLRARLKDGLSPGRYRATVKWLSPDGHIQSRTWSFRLR